MALVRELEQALRDVERTRAAEASFRDLRKFFDEMKRLGLVVKHDYGLPPIDTVGRSAHRAGD